MGDSNSESIISGSTRKFISEEVKRQVKEQMTSLAKSVDDVKRQNGEQSAHLAKLTSAVVGIDAWKNELWGNGSGRKGFLEKARAEDKEQYAQIFTVVTDLREEKLKEEGKNDLRKEIELNRVEIEKLADVKKTQRLSRFHLWITILSSFAGAWTLTLLRPLLHIVVGYVVQLVK